MRRYDDLAQVSIRVGPEVVAVVGHAAEGDGTSAGYWIRHLLDKGAR